MLVIERRRDETVILTVGGIRIEVMVCGFRDTKAAVRLGFKAPRDAVVIHRGEVQEEIDSEREKANADH